MFDDISELDSVNITEIKDVDSGSGYSGGSNNNGNNNNGNNGNGGYKQNNGYQGNNNGNNNGGYQRNNNGGNNGGGNGGGYQRNGGGGGGGGGFKRKEEVLEEPYVPVSIFVDREFPPEAKNSLYNIASKLINKKITVRVNGDDKEFCGKLMALSSQFVEVYVPWKGFNDMETKHYWNTITAKHLAQQNFGAAWEKIPDSVKALMARNVRMIFGDKNNSIMLCLITWSKDAASRAAEVTKDTGRPAFIIKTASSYSFPVVNIAKPGAENILEKSFGL